MATKPVKKNPRLASGRKRVRQDVKINAANTSLRSKYRTAVKNVEKSVALGLRSLEKALAAADAAVRATELATATAEKTRATELFAKAQSVLDVVADKGIFHKNKAARDKSRLSAKVKNFTLAINKAAA